MRHVTSIAFVFSLVPASALAAKGEPAAKGVPPGISQASVSAAVSEFVLALGSHDEERVLAAISPSDRLALRGRENLIGTVYERALQSPNVKSFEKVSAKGKDVGVKAVVTVQEIDSIDGTTAPKEKTWYLVLDGNTLKVSIVSVWLDGGGVGGSK